MSEHHRTREASGSRGRVAYIMSRFPKLTETFILYELLAVESHGWTVDVYPLIRQVEPVIQPEAVAVMKRARYAPFISWGVLRSQAHWLARRPRAYIGALAAVVRGNLGSRRLLTRGLAVFPKVAHAARQMESDGVQHVHCHFATQPALAGFIIHRLTGIPYSFTAHGTDLHVDRQMLCEKIAEARAVVTISDYNRQLIHDECGERATGRVSVIHCGVDTSSFEPRTSPADQPFTIVCVGTLHEVKGQAYLVDACRRLADAGIDFRCHFIGDGPDRATLTDRIERGGLSERVVLEGPRTRDEIIEHLAKADVLAAPSVPTASGQREGIPIVLMEAMSSGLPVVASRLSGIPELVEDGVSGLLVPPRDAEALAAALKRLADDAALRVELGAAGRHRVESDFDVVSNARGLAALFAAPQSRR